MTYRCFQISASKSNKDFIFDSLKRIHIKQSVLQEGVCILAFINRFQYNVNTIWSFGRTINKNVRWIANDIISKFRHCTTKTQHSIHIMLPPISKNQNALNLLQYAVHHMKGNSEQKTKHKQIQTNKKFIKSQKTIMQNKMIYIINGK